MRKRRTGAAPRGGVSAAWLLIGSLLSNCLCLQPLLPCSAVKVPRAPPGFQAGNLDRAACGIVQTYLRPPVRRTQPDFSSVLPTDKGDLVALSVTRSEKQAFLWRRPL